MSQYSIINIQSKNGVQRDGTEFNSPCYIDAQWNRFWEGTPKKIGGCQLLQKGNTTVVGSMFSYLVDNKVDIYTGRYNSVTMFSITKQNQTPSNILDITPTDTSNWNPLSEKNLWDFDIYTSAEGGGSVLESVSYLYAHVAENRQDTASAEEGPIFATSASTPGTLQPILAQTSSIDTEPLLVSGGVVFSSPVMVAYGNSGTIYWSDESDDPTNPWPLYARGADNQLPANIAILSNTKIVKGVPYRGSIIFWSLHELISATYNVITVSIDDPEQKQIAYPTFSSNVIERGISIMSPNSVIQYNNMIYWPGIDQFYEFNGVVGSMLNHTNSDWFYKNINTQASAKVWGVAQPRYKELWWFYPRLPYTPPEGKTMADQECNAVIIHNLETKDWYDCTIPPDAPLNGVYPWTRSAGISASSNYPYPVWADNTTVQINYNIGSQSTKPIWTHEIGTDYVLSDTQRFAIPAYFTTSYYTLWDSNPSLSNYLYVQRIAPDFVQSGDMTVTINSKKYPNSVLDNTSPILFSDDPESANYKEYIDFETQNGLVSFTFASNVLNGDYHMGKPQLYFGKGDMVK
jgi:hypothetical protein